MGFLTVAISMKPSPNDKQLTDHIQALSNLADDIDILSVIENEIKAINPKAIIFNKSSYNAPSKYLFDESIDCIFSLFDLLDKIQPSVAHKLALEFSEETNAILYKAVESGIYLLCKPDIQSNDDMTDGFYEWITMENDKRIDIEKTIVQRTKSAFKLSISKQKMKKIDDAKHGQYLYTKCLKKLKPNKIKTLYQQLRIAYPQQRQFMDLIPSVFMYSCARNYATTEWIQVFMQTLTSMDDADMFFNYLADEMIKYLDGSAGNDECIEHAQRDGLTHKMEMFLFERHGDFKQFPVYNAINGLIELACAKKFVFKEESVSDMDDILRNGPQQEEVLHPDL